MVSPETEAASGPVWGKLRGVLEQSRGLFLAAVGVGVLHLVVLWVLGVPAIASDASAYDEMAQGLLVGKTWVSDGIEQTAWMPGYPTFVALVYLLFGVKPWAVYSVQAFLIGLDAALLFVVARRLVGPRLAPWGFLFFALAPVFFIYPGALAAENLTLLLVLLFLEALSSGPPSSLKMQVLWVLRFGLVGGLLCFTRAEFSLWMAAVPVLMLGREKLARVVGLTALAATVVLLCLMPWIVRNERAHGEFIPATTLSGRALWLSAQMPEETEVGSPRYLALQERCSVNHRPKEFDACLAADAREAIKSHPAYFAKTSVLRAARTLVGSHTDFLAQNAQKSSFRQVIAERRWGLFLFKIVNFALHGALVVAAALGLWRQRKSRVWQILTVAIAWKLAVHAILFGTARYGVPLQPLFLLAALALAAPKSPPKMDESTAEASAATPR